MVNLDLAKVSGIGAWEKELRSGKDGEALDEIYKIPEGKAFLVLRPKTVEVRCERNLGRKLQEEYETVMESRYFGRGGVEIVPTGQLDEGEIEDLVRLSYNLTVEMQEV